MIICTTLPAFEDEDRVADHKCTIVYLFHTPNDLRKFTKVGFVLYHHSRLSVALKTIQMFIRHFVSNSSGAIRHFCICDDCIMT